MGDYGYSNKAINENNIESLEIASLQIIIAPPYWETW
jgi:hypothetical protein